MEDFNTGVRHRNDTRNFSMGLSGAAVERKDAVVHLEDSSFDHDDTVHLFFDVKFPDAMLTTILIEFH